MNIPTADLHFQKPTAIVTMNKDKAKFFIGSGDQLDFVNEIAIDDSYVHGGLGHAHSSPGVVGAPAGETDRMHWNEHNRKALFGQINDALKMMLQEKKIEAIIIAVPHEHKNELMEQLDTMVAEKVSKMIAKDLFGFDDLRLLEAISQA